jgi:hypothetical protein
MLPCSPTGYSYIHTIPRIYATRWCMARFIMLGSALFFCYNEATEHSLCFLVPTFKASSPEIADTYMLCGCPPPPWIIEEKNYNCLSFGDIWSLGASQPGRSGKDCHPPFSRKSLAARNAKVFLLVHEHVSVKLERGCD